MFGRKSHGTGLVDTTHLSDNLWVRQLQETQCEHAEEAHGVDNTQKEKMEIWHGKPEEEFKPHPSASRRIFDVNGKEDPTRLSKSTIKVRNTAGPETNKVVNLNCVKKFIPYDDEDRELADDEYEVEKILDHHYTSQGLEYRLKWKGFWRVVS
ncbi:reverse transcriptase [Balamuthia mandrillaris]